MKRNKRIKLSVSIFVVLLGLMLFGGQSAATEMSIEIALFGATSEGTPVYAYTLTNQNGVKANFITLGGTLQAFHVPGGQTGTIKVLTSNRSTCVAVTLLGKRFSIVAVDRSFDQ